MFVCEILRPIEDSDSDSDSDSEVAIHDSDSSVLRLTLPNFRKGARQILPNLREEALRVLGTLERLNDKFYDEETEDPAGDAKDPAVVSKSDLSKRDRSPVPFKAITLEQEDAAVEGRDENDSKDHVRESQEPRHRSRRAISNLEQDWVGHRLFPKKKSHEEHPKSKKHGSGHGKDMKGREFAGKELAGKDSIKEKVRTKWLPRFQSSKEKKGSF